MISQKMKRMLEMPIVKRLEREERLVFGEARLRKEKQSI
jgi:hypothetical protein